MSKKIDIKHVSALSGVSIATISRVLNGTANVTSDTRKKVEKAISKTGYRKNEFASNFRRKSTGFVGLIIPDCSNEYFAQLAKVIENKLQESGYKLFLCNTDEDIEKEKWYIDSLIDHRISGLIVASSQIDQIETYLQDIGIPLVLIDRITDDTEDNDNKVCIESDNFQGGRSAADFLISKGAKKILLLRDKKNIRPHNQREDGFITSMLKNNIPKEEYFIEYTASDFQQIATVVSGAYEKYHFDAVFCSSDKIAVGAIHGLRNYGIVVPDEVQVIGFDGIAWGGYIRPSLSTVKQDIEKIGMLASSKIYEMIGEHKVLSEHIIVPTKIIEKETTK